MNSALLAALNVERAARRSAIVVLDLASGEQRLVTAAELPNDPLRAILEPRLRSGQSGVVDAEGRQVFLSVHVPPPRLVVIGAVHISQALAPMAALLDYDVVIIDPRTAFATPERFPGSRLLAEWPEIALPEVGVDQYTAFAALTHDPKIDDPALLHALSRDCFYVGALGSRKTHARRIERLRGQGASEAALARIHAPIGLAIGAASPAEIAVSIIAQITASLRLPRDKPE